MTTTSGNDKRGSWWGRHRRWVVPAALAPIGYVAFALVGGQLTSAGNGQESIGLSLLGLLFLLAAFAAPIVFGIIAIRRGHDAYRAWQRSLGHLTKREQSVQSHQDAYAYGWRHAVSLRASLMRKELPPEIQVWNVVPHHGERFFLSGFLGYARYYGTDVTYGQTGVVAFGRPAWVAGAVIGNAIGNSIARSRAQAMAATQWREQQQVNVVVSNQRLVCNVGGRGWLSFDWSAVTAIYPDPEQYNVVLEFGGQTSPLSLTGAMAPALATMAVMLTHGHDALAGHPALQALRA